MSKYDKWADRVGIIAEMAARGCTDGQIGDVFGVGNQTIYAVRAYHKIPTNSRAGGFQKRAATSEPEPQPELPVVNGVKQCPTRWLEGAGNGPTARPRR
ncbi:hypothetical protein [Limnoglobus roseus]|uniref:Uncharacterized protein n=1 Tax=Limnoglobus roseus TaxID=2598579 RepID=A0A5C1AAA5_9BACT|nr:hypothetical protein [Limnoglobus roseus]QEL14752.1 hypothetical protein PX52LOC_01646 [Limnoglobus roseus]